MRERGCIIEIRENTMIAMTASCNFVEVPRQPGNIYPGQEIEWVVEAASASDSRGNMQVKLRHKWAAWGVAAALIFLLVTGGLLITPGVFAEPAYIVTIDINPSFKMLLDHQGIVLKTEALNEEAADLKLKHLRRMPVEEALAGLLLETDRSGLLDRNRAHYMVISVVSLDPDDTDQHQQLLERTRIQGMRTDHEETIQFKVLSLPASAVQLEKAANQAVNLNQIVVLDAYRSIYNIDLEENQNSDQAVMNVPMEAMVRSVLQHQSHPVFEVHPGLAPPDYSDPETMDEDSERSHPVFDVHPGQNNDVDFLRELKEEQIQQSPVTKGAEMDERNHPVFDIHPGDRTNQNGQSVPLHDSEGNGNHPDTAKQTSESGKD